jgi:protein-tyrosine phosphatase
MAEVMLRDRFARAGATGSVSSAGTICAAGIPASDGSIEMAAQRGLSLEGHRSRRLTADLVRSTDLVLGMSREHVREAAVAAPDCFGRVFTLKQLVRLGDREGPRRQESFATWLGAVGADRKTSDLLGADEADDIADPMGQRLAEYARTADEIEGLLDRLVALIRPEPPAADAFPRAAAPSATSGAVEARAAGKRE